MVDLTTLEGPDTRQGARAGRQGDAARPADPSCPTTAAVCVYPDMVAMAKVTPARRRQRRGRRHRVPERACGLDIKLADTRDAVEAGADEIDMVIDRGAFLSGRYLDVSTRSSP